MIFTDRPEPNCPQDPGRVFPGKKMAGRLGGERTTVQNLFVQRIDTSLNLVFVKGAVPGPDDGFVFVRSVRGFSIPFSRN